MNYSTCLMALVASRVQEVQAEVTTTLEPHLQRVAALVTSFFGGRGIARRGPEIGTGTGDAVPRTRAGGH
jgi:hypothetical protein